LPQDYDNNYEIKSAKIMSETNVLMLFYDEWYTYLVNVTLESHLKVAVFT